MAAVWIEFANRLGWPSDENEEKILIIGSRDEIVLASETDYDRLFRRGRGQIMQAIGWKRCFRMGEILQGCYPDD
jgi:hypothetical protein